MEHNRHKLMGGMGGQHRLQLGRHQQTVFLGSVRIHVRIRNHHNRICHNLHNRILCRIRSLYIQDRIQRSHSKRQGMRRLLVQQ